MANENFDNFDNFDNNNTTGDIDIDKILSDDNFDYTQFGEPDEDSLESKFYDELIDAIYAAARIMQDAIFHINDCDSYGIDEESEEIKIIKKNANYIFDRLNNIMMDYGEEKE